jgi:Zn-finger nucleic acid-binding protein
MNRVNFGYRSGVVVDQCRKHGIWLDSGEITHLMEWKKAGGQLWNHQQQAKQDSKTPLPDLNRDFSLRNSYPQFESDAEPDLLKTLSTLVFKLFD